MLSRRTASWIVAVSTLYFVVMNEEINSIQISLVFQKLLRKTGDKMRRRSKKLTATWLVSRRLRRRWNSTALRLPSQLQNVPASWPVPNYIAWWQARVRRLGTTCPKLLPEGERPGLEAPHPDLQCPKRSPPDHYWWHPSSLIIIPDDDHASELHSFPK